MRFHSRLQLLLWSERRRRHGLVLGLARRQVRCVRLRSAGSGSLAWYCRPPDRFSMCATANGGGQHNLYMGYGADAEARLPARGGEVEPSEIPRNGRVFRGSRTV